jgi:hypothetical protein
MLAQTNELFKYRFALRFIMIMKEEGLVEEVPFLWQKLRTNLFMSKYFVVSRYKNLKISMIYSTSQGKFGKSVAYIYFQALIHVVSLFSIIASLAQQQMYA